MYEFTNQEKDVILQKKNLSPSQRKRNLARKKEFEENKLVKLKPDKVKVEEKHEILKKYCEVQTNSDEKLRTKDSESQTEVTYSKTVGVNTDDVEVEALENTLEVDEHGKIHARKNEIIVEMKVSHTFKNWEEIESHILENLKLTLVGKPWISNNGRQFMTIGFRTNHQDFENWKARTLNYQDSGLLAVSSSRLYR